MNVRSQVFLLDTDTIAIRNNKKRSAASYGKPYNFETMLPHNCGKSKMVDEQTLFKRL